MTMGDEETEEKSQYEGFDSISEWINSLAGSEGKLGSPINISLTYAMPLNLEPLQWRYFQTVPKKLKITNTGQAIQISASWYQEKPLLCGGPLEDKFEFSQLHFHWGSTDMEGSEHFIDGVAYPLEMHVVFFKSVYLTHEAAVKEKDGVVVVVYVFKLHPRTNVLMEYIIEKVRGVRYAVSSERLLDIPLNFFVKKFQDDYFLYWGSIITSTKSHIILWLICREPMGITLEQMERFRIMFNADDQPMLRNFRQLQPLGKRHLFHISPSTVQYSSLLPIPLPDESYETTVANELNL